MVYTPICLVSGKMAQWDNLLSNWMKRRLRMLRMPWRKADLTTTKEFILVQMKNSIYSHYPLMRPGYQFGST